MPDFPPLVADETVLWEGRPATSLQFGASTMAGTIFAVALLLACLGLATVIERSTPGVYWRILAPGLVIAGAIVALFLLMDQRKRQNTAYRLTNKRAVIRRGGRSESYALPSADQIQLSGTGSQSVTFGRDARGVALVFESLANASEVHQMMRQAAQAGRMTDAAQHAKDRP